MIILVLLILFSPETANSGMHDWIDLCLKSLIPSIFPLLFMIALLSQHINYRPHGKNNRFFRFLGLNGGSRSIFLLCLISGYPVGAVTIQDFLERGIIREQDANRLMSFCNNAGPAFISVSVRSFLGRIGLPGSFGESKSFRHVWSQYSCRKHVVFQQLLKT